MGNILNKNKNLSDNLAHNLEIPWQSYIKGMLRVSDTFWMVLRWWYFPIGCGTVYTRYDKTLDSVYVIREPFYNLWYKSFYENIFQKIYVDVVSFLLKICQFR